MGLSLVVIVAFGVCGAGAMVAGLYVLQGRTKRLSGTRKIRMMPRDVTVGFVQNEYRDVIVALEEANHGEASDELSEFMRGIDGLLEADERVRTTFVRKLWEMKDELAVFRDQPGQLTPEQQATHLRNLVGQLRLSLEGQRREYAHAEDDVSKRGGGKSPGKTTPRKKT